MPRLNLPATRPPFRDLTLALGALCCAAAAPAQQPRFERLSRDGFPTSIEFSLCATALDVDGDGDVDLFVGNDRDGDRLYINDGSGIFGDESATRLPPLPTGATRGAASGDFDLDGDIDLLLARDFPSWQNRLLLNDGSGRFLDASAQLPQGNDQSRSVSVGDVDGDGDLDAVIANFNQVDVLLLNDGAARFSVAGPPRYPVSMLNSELTQLIDIDGDNDLDAVTGLNKTAGVRRDQLYLNDGTGTFLDVSAVTIPALGARTTSIAAADFDADGDLDLFLGQGIGVDLLLLNDGTNAFVPAPSGMLPAIDTISLGAIARDFDGDQDIDLVIGVTKLSGVGTNRLYLNDGTGRMLDQGATTPGPARTRQLISDDFDGNGSADLLELTEQSRNRLWFNDGTARFEDAVQNRMPTSFPADGRLVLADVDGDGDQDCFVAAGRRLSDKLMLNDGLGFFEDVSASLPQTVTAATGWIACGDMDGDGDLDVFLARDGQNVLWRNTGAATFIDVTGSNLPASSDRTAYAAWFDADGDGDLDVVTANDRAQNRLLLNDGRGRLTDATFGRMPSETNESYFIAPIDIDTDGDQDLLVVHRYYNTIYINDGVGYFFDGSSRLFPPQTYQRTLNIATGDVDRDGDIDLLLGDRFQPDRLYLNDGSGRFSDASATNVLATNDRPDEVQLADLDGDGDLDAVRGAGDIWLNDGTGIFTDAPAGEYPDLGLSNAVADLDADGDLDIASLNGVHVNLNRQLAIAAPARSGSSLRIRSFARRGGGQASTTFLTLLGSRRLPTPLRIPGLGLLGIDLSGVAIALPPIPVSQPMGVGALDLPIPADPNLVGIQLVLQAIETGTDARLTNLVSDRIRG